MARSARLRRGRNRAGVGWLTGHGGSPIGLFAMARGIGGAFTSGRRLYRALVSERRNDPGPGFGLETPGTLRAFGLSQGAQCRGGGPAQTSRNEGFSRDRR